jgi:predicted regulator of Ras-like GTPase activity (Roadblock/LC7/MglB family)
VGPFHAAPEGPKGQKAKIFRLFAGTTMSFREHLAEVCESVEGALACTLMGVDGIEVDTHLQPQPGQQGGGDLDMKSLLVEYSGVFRSAREAAEAHEAGGVAEVSISTDKVLTVARLVTPEYFMVVALSPDGNLGKARFKLRVTAPLLRSEL